jgi:hypothetical protein
MKTIIECFSTVFILLSTVLIIPVTGQNLSIGEYLRMLTPEMNFRGRSLYWGEIWVSMEDKQVEYAVMTEDVIFELKLNNSSPKQLLDLQREVTFSKI